MHFEISYNEDRVIEINLSRILKAINYPRRMRNVGLDFRTASVKPTSMGFKDRMDKYSRYSIARTHGDSLV